MKNRNRLSEKEIKELLAGLKSDQAQYPPELLENRRAKFLASVPAAGFVIGSKAIYKALMHGIQSTAAGVTKVILLSVIGVAAAGTLLFGYDQGWASYIKDEIKTNVTMVAPSTLAETNPAFELENTSAAVHLTETTGPSLTPTISPTQTFTPTPTPIGTFTPTPAADGNPIPEPNIEPTNPPIIEPTEPPIIEPTEPPVIEPTEPPIIEPTEPPVIEPTDPPIIEPTDPPIIEPTDIPDDDHHDNGNHYGQTPHPTKKPHTL